MNIKVFLCKLDSQINVSHLCVALLILNDLPILKIDPPDGICLDLTSARPCADFGSNGCNTTF